MKLDYKLFEAGFCLHCEKMTLKKGRLKQTEYPALCALIKHPTKGYILFDTGYSNRFHQLTQKFPFFLYRWLTPVTLHQSLHEQLVAHKINASEIKYIVISHFHADHIGGLKDFPNAQFICHPEAVESIRHKKGFKALLSGFLPDLLPNNFYQRLICLNNPVSLNKSVHPFTTGYDLFQDGSLYAISLPGHAPGQIGLYFKACKETFLVADSCWHQEAFQSLSYPSELTYLIHHNKKQYQQTIKRLHILYQSNQTIDIIPSHCIKSRPLKQGS